MTDVDTLLLGAGLSKRFRHVLALDHVDVQLSRGDAVALLGPNGAGKTTLLRILAGASDPTQGRVDHESRVARIGWVPHDPALYRRLTTRENIRLFCELEGTPHSVQATEHLLERTDLARYADQPAGELSTGTLHRLNLAIALAGRPDILLLDEPTATLSADQVHRLWTWLDELRAADGLAVLFSTQSVDEAARYAQRMMILDRGHLAFQGDLASLIAQHGVANASPADAAEKAFLNLVGSQ